MGLMKEVGKEEDAVEKQVTPREEDLKSGAFVLIVLSAEGEMKKGAMKEVGKKAGVVKRWAIP